METPGQSVSNSWINGPNIQIGSAGGNVVLIIDRPDYQLQWLQPVPRQQWLPKRQRTPSYLLDARREIVPYRPRVQLQEKLLAWRDESDVPMSVLLVHGPGGRGKTRLANALASNTHDSGWTVAQAIHRATAPGSLLASPSTLRGGHDPETKNSSSLVVIDYAERWDTDILVRLIASLPLEHPTKTIRVLLLARSRDLWGELVDQLDRLPIELPEPIELGDLTSSLGERQEAYIDATTAFRTALEVPSYDPIIQDLSDPSYRSPLILHMTALADVCAVMENTPRPNLNDLSAYLLRHEGRYWPSESPGQQTIVTRNQARSSVFLATLFGPLPNVATACSLLKKAGVTEDIATARSVVDWHDRLYPNETETLDINLDQHPALQPLKPDRFAEDFIAEYVTGGSRATELLTQLLLVFSQEGTLDALAIRRCLIVLAAAADRHERPRPLLWYLLAKYSFLASFVSMPLIEILTTYAPRELCISVSRALPDYRVDLIRPALHLAQHLVDTMTNATDNLERAQLLGDLGIRLAHAGETQMALSVTHEATDIHRMLASTDPTVHLPGLAGSLNNLGIRLGQAGSRQAALTASIEATSLYRQLVETDQATYLPTLAMSLMNLGNQLGDAGERQAAVTATREAVAIERRLAKEDSNLYLPALATSLNNLGNQLGDAGERQAAVTATREAVKIRLQLVESDPGVYLADLASSLSNLGIQLGATGQKKLAVKYAQQAADLHRQLVRIEPNAYLPELALSLNNLASQLSEAGDIQAALTVAREAVEILRSVVAADPAPHLADLVGFLSNLGNRLGDAGEKVEAVDPALEAVDVSRQLVTVDPASYSPYLAMSLSNLGIRLGEAGEKASAVGPVREAVDIYRKLADSDFAAYSSDLAMSINNLGVRLAEAGEFDAAAVQAREAVKIRRQLAEADPDAHLPDLAMSITNLGNRLAEAGEFDAAAVQAREAVKIRRQLAEADPDAYLPDLARSLNNYGFILANIGDKSGAAEASREAVKIYRGLAEIDAEAYRPDLAMSLRALVSGQLVNNDTQPAITLSELLIATQEAKSIYGLLAARWPRIYAGYLRTVYSTEVELLERLDRIKDVAEIRNLIADNPP